MRIKSAVSARTWPTLAFSALLGSLQEWAFILENPVGCVLPIVLPSPPPTLPKNIPHYGSVHGR